MIPAEQRQEKHGNVGKIQEKRRKGARDKMKARRILKKSLAGSITVEASLIVPVFFLAVFAFMYLFEAITLQKQMQEELATVNRDYAATGIQTPFVKSEQGSIHLIRWNIEGSGGSCSLDISQRIPGIPSGLLQLNIYQNVQISSYAGRSMVSDRTDQDTEYVYIAENASVYHRKIDCTYLKLGIQSAAGNQVENLRNQSGGKYYACESCTEGGEADDYQEVYITPYGARFHCSRDCSGLRRSVRKVELSSVAALPPCSKCGSAP